MQIGDRVLVLVDEVPGTTIPGELPGVPVPEGTYGAVVSLDEGAHLPVGVELESDPGDPWYFEEDHLEVVSYAAE